MTVAGCDSFGKSVGAPFYDLFWSEEPVPSENESEMGLKPHVALQSGLRSENDWLASMNFND